MNQLQNSRFSRGPSYKPVVTLLVQGTVLDQFQSTAQL
jgi:hypothetical protein